MFPPAGAHIYRNEAGEPTGWDAPETEADFADRLLDRYLEEDFRDDRALDDEYDERPGPPTDDRDFEEEEYNRNYCDACGSSVCTWNGEPDGFHQL